MCNQTSQVSHVCDVMSCVYWQIVSLHMWEHIHVNGSVYCFAAAARHNEWFWTFKIKQSILWDNLFPQILFFIIKHTVMFGVTQPKYRCVSLYRTQWLFFGRNYGQLTPEIIYFHYLRKCFLDQSIWKIFYLILKKEALTGHCYAGTHDTPEDFRATEPCSSTELFSF